MTAPATSPARTPPTRKGAETRELILAQAIEVVTREGLDALTIGSLAETVGMSKSGLFAHFGSREELQLAVLDQVAHEFTQEVFAPALRRPRGLPRLRAILENWQARTLRLGEHRGCPVAASALEFDDRPGPVRDSIMGYVAQLRVEVARAVRLAIEEGHVAADVDPEQVSFELHGLMLAFHFEVKLVGPAAARPRVVQATDRLLAALAAN